MITSDHNETNCFNEYPLHNMQRNFKILYHTSKTANSTINPLAAKFFMPFRGMDIIFYMSSPSMEFFPRLLFGMEFFLGTQN